MRLLLSRFTVVGSGYSPCGSHPLVTILAVQQNR